MDADLQLRIAVVVAVLVVLWVLADWGTYRERALRLGRWVGVVGPEAPRPSGPSIERIAADAERIRSTLRHAQPGTPVARMRGWVLAYDDVLVMACRTLDVEQRLEQLPLGGERDLERERVERVLVGAGLLRSLPR